MNTFYEAIRRRNKRRRKIFLLTLLSEKNHRVPFQLQTLSDSDCVKNFRFTLDHIKRLQAVLRIPFTLRCKGTFCTGIEGLCVLLRRMAYPNRYHDMKILFNRPTVELNQIFISMTNYIYNRFGHLLQDFNQEWLNLQHVQLYAGAIANKGAPMHNCWGFIDGTVRPICRPKYHQRICYNGHKRVHALKYQSVVAPNGLIANFYGPVEGRRHDAFLLSESNILQNLENEPFRNFSLYGDPAYPLRPQLIGPYKGNHLTQDQQNFNSAMSMNRVVVEWVFGKIVNTFAFLDFKKNQKIFLQQVGKQFKVAVILTNCHTCLYGSQTSSFFNLPPPSLEDYLQFNNEA